jgi:branched-chain amino acid transport system ATP-binding protein
MALLELKDVRTFYGNIQALKGISISVDEGEIVTLIGANGQPKNDDTHEHLRYHSSSLGQILLNGKEISRVSPNKIVKMGVSQVPEGRAYFPSSACRKTWTWALFCAPTRKV